MAKLSGNPQISRFT